MTPRHPATGRRQAGGMLLGLVIGAAASLESAWQALVQEWPALRDLWLRFAAPPLRARR